MNDMSLKEVAEALATIRWTGTVNHKQFIAADVAASIVRNFNLQRWEETVMPDIITRLKAAYMRNPAEALGMLSELFEAEERIVELPCKVGDTIYVITQCKNVAVRRDDDYETGTGATECPFESSCDIEDCDDDQIRIFETEVTDFWLGEQNGKTLEMMFEGLQFTASANDIGHTVFLTRTEAEQAMKEAER